MRYTLYTRLISIALLLSLVSCKKNFLEKPNTTGTTTAETVFSNKAGAEAALANAYQAILSHGLWPDGSINNGSYPGISGESSFGESWMTLAKFISSGFGSIPWDGNRSQSPDNLFNNFREIRKCYIIIANVDKATDLDQPGKDLMKAEMKALIAYRYFGMFIRYGGVPIVTKVNDATDLSSPRATLQETIDFIIKNCDDAAAILPNTWPATYNGRMTKGAAMAIKAKALLFAARPLFNSTTPYIRNGATDKLICFGSVSNQRWTDAVTANEAVLTWANANSYSLINTGGGAGMPNVNAFDDYATATSTPNNKEVLLAYKYDVQDSKYYNFYNAPFNGNRYLIDNYGLLTNFLENYYKADGTNQSWPGLGAGNAQPFSVFQSKMNEMEPRFLADNVPHTFNAKSNPGDNGWVYTAHNAGYDNFGKGGNRGPSGRGRGAAITVKFYYKAGSRNWFEFPIFRIAEIYLALAEAYNESGNSAKALLNLNMVHNRAGLPSITVTDPAQLRKIIQREWAVEFYYENHRFFDARHWKLADIGNGIIGGPMRELQFTVTGDATLPSGYVNFYDNTVFTAYWDPKMFLLPIPQEEVDKGVILQNPGY